MTRISLFERFSAVVPDRAPSSITRVTEAADTETYDDDSGIYGLGVPGAGHRDLLERETTRHTFSTETYDDDPGHHGLGTPRGSDSTSFTRVEGETYDDDPGVWPLSLPEVDGR